MSQLVNVNGVNRIMPAASVQAYQTYQILAPLQTHFRPATCAEVDCAHYLHGWACTVQEGSQDEAVIRAAGRRFTVERQADGFLRFVFPPGQPCFRASVHRVCLEREPIFRVKAGDWRRNLGVLRVHTSAESWRDDFGEHQERIADQINEG